jgi:hypothetical protein
MPDPILGKMSKKIHDKPQPLLTSCQKSLTPPSPLHRPTKKPHPPGTVRAGLPDPAASQLHPPIDTSEQATDNIPLHSISTHTKKTPSPTQRRVFYGSFTGEAKTESDPGRRRKGYSEEERKRREEKMIAAFLKGKFLGWVWRKGKQALRKRPR